MLISFIVPTYGIADSLVRECLDSILALDLSADEREIITLDDPAQEGLSVVRNRGLAQARGTYVQFIDGDDALIPAVYNKIISELRKEHYFGKVDILFFRFTRKQSCRRRLGAYGAWCPPLFWRCSNREYLLKKNLRAAAWGYVFRRELVTPPATSTVSPLRFTPGIFHEDEEFTPLLLLRAPTVLYCSLCAYYYRQRAGSITTCSDAAQLSRRQHDFLDIILRLRQFMLTHSHRSGGVEGSLLSRRINQLKMDYAYRYRHLPRVLGPLPLRFYTLKYFAFAVYSRLFIK